MSYEKHHSPSNMAIPEDDSQEVRVRVVRQINGIDSSKLQPIIRFHPDSDYRVQYIEYQPIDYYSVFRKTSTTNRRRNAETKKPHTVTQTHQARPANARVANTQPV